MKKTIHTLLIPSWYPPYDGGSFFEEQAQLLLKKGVKVGVSYVEQKSLKTFSLKSFIKSHFQTSINKENGLPIVRIHGWAIPKLEFLNYKLWTYLMVKAIGIYIKKFGKPELIHVHSSLWGSVVAYKVKKKWKIPYVITEHRGRFTNLTKLAKSQFKWWYSKPLHKGLFSSDKIMPVSKRLNDKLQSFVPDKKLPITVIPNIVDIDFFKPSSTISKKNKFTFLLVANLTPVKGVDLLLPAFSKILVQYPDIQLRIGGDGYQRKSLEHQVEKLGITESVSFLGNLSREQVRDEMMTAYSFVLSSRIEAHPIVTCEAMAMGLPILATSVVSDDVVTRDTGILVKPDSINALEQGLIQAVQQYEQFNPVKIREFAIQHFSYDVVFKQIESVYDEVLTTNEH